MRYALYDQAGALLRHQYFAEQPPDPVGKGWRWVEDPEPPAEPAPPPERVNNSQMRAALAMAGSLTGIETFLDNLPEPDRTVARIGWDFGNEVYRVSPLVQAAQAALQLTDEQVDDLFRRAASIEF